MTMAMTHREYHHCGQVAALCVQLQKQQSVFEGRVEAARKESKQVRHCHCHCHHHRHHHHHRHRHRRDDHQMIISVSKAAEERGWRLQAATLHYKHSLFLPCPYFHFGLLGLWEDVLTT